MRKLIAILALGLMVACSATADLEDPFEPIGTFRLGHNIVVAKNATVGPLSREATPAEWKQTFEGEIARRLGRYDGTGLFHLGISIDGYVLAIPGIPVVASPKSALIFTVHLWDDNKAQKLTEEPKQFTVLEAISAESILGSGLTRSKEDQMRILSQQGAKQIERWLQRNPEWFNSVITPAEPDA